MTRALVVTPCDDVDSTRMAQYISRFLGAIPAGWSINILTGPKQTTRTAIDGALQATDVLIYAGHGRPDALTLRNGTVLVDQTNLGATQLLVAIACETGRQLGSTMTVLNGPSFIGTSQVWMVFHPSAAIPEPTDAAVSDALLQLGYGHTVALVATGLRAGLGWGVAYYTAGNGRQDPNFQLGAASALWNAQFLVQLGSGALTF